MVKLRVTGEIEVPQHIADAILDKWIEDRRDKHIRYHVSFYADADEFTRHSVNIPIELRQIIE